MKNMFDRIFFTHEFVTEHKFYLSQVGNRLREFPTEVPLKKQLRHGDYMSIIVNLYYTGKNGAAKRFAEEMESSGIANAIRQEEGNEKYEYFFSMSDPETVLLIDSWRDQEAIDFHHASPMMDTIARLREKYDLHMRMERYLSDDDGVPAKDDNFIRK